MKNIFKRRGTKKPETGSTAFGRMEMPYSAEEHPNVQAPARRKVVNGVGNAQMIEELKRVQMQRNSARQNAQGRENDQKEISEREQAGQENKNEFYPKLLEMLKTTKRRGIHRQGESEGYYHVVKSLEFLVRAMNERFTEDPEENLRRFELMKLHYMDLEAACGTYTAIHKVLNGEGTERKKIIFQLQKMVKSDLLRLDSACTEFCAMPPEEQKGKSWKDILSRIRMVRLVTEDLFHTEKEKEGACSEVFRISNKNAKILNPDGSKEELDKTYFFKEEDEIYINTQQEKREERRKLLEKVPQEKQAGLSQTDHAKLREWTEHGMPSAVLPDLSASGKQILKSLSAQVSQTDQKKFQESAQENAKRVLKRFPKIGRREKKKIMKWAGTLTESSNPIGNSKFTEEAKKACQIIHEVTVSQDSAVRSTLGPAGIEKKAGESTVNTTKRNVATSRVAALLGLQGIVAKSETVEIFDKKSGQTLRGNMMEGAQGNTVLKDYSDTEIRNLGKLPPKLSGAVQRDLASLQVLDVLCGQVDRHYGNIMITVKRGNGQDEITGIHAFDNDAAFGMIQDVSTVTSNMKFDKRVYDPNTGKLVIPFMDASLAERILELRPVILGFALNGLLTEAEINAAIQRLKMMQDAIRREKASERARNVQPGRSRFRKHDEWNEETQEITLAANKAAKAENGNYTGYVMSALENFARKP